MDYIRKQEINELIDIYVVSDENKFVNEFVNSKIRINWLRLSKFKHRDSGYDKYSSRNIFNYLEWREIEFLYGFTLRDVSLHRRYVENSVFRVQNHLTRSELRKLKKICKKNKLSINYEKNKYTRKFETNISIPSSMFEIYGLPRNWIAIAVLKTNFLNRRKRIDNYLRSFHSMKNEQNKGVCKWILHRIIQIKRRIFG